jgi:hypothetical protein
MSISMDATTEKQPGLLERALRAFSSEQAQRAVATLEVTLPIPGVSSVISAINFAQHSCATCINVIDGEISRGVINACQALADVGQIIAGFFPIGETIVDIASFGLEFADSFITSYNKGAQGERPPLSPNLVPARVHA